MIQFRIDDIGASSKKYEQYGKTVFQYHGKKFFYFPFFHIGFLKRVWPFRKWGPYTELLGEEWRIFLALFKKYSIQPIIAVTAAWVDEKSILIPFPEKFPDEAAVLKEALQKNEIIIANHGLTHCVIGEHLPRFWTSNRRWHREFYDWIPEDVHKDHILRSQEILETYFENPIEIFVPPGNVWSIKTYRALKETNIKKVICNRYMTDSTLPVEDIEFIDDRKGFFNFHDRELKLYGVQWLVKNIEKYAQ